MEKTDIARTIAALEADLKRVRKDAEIFGRDLKALRAEKERSQDKQKEEVAKAERAKKQAQTQIRLLSEQLSSQKAKAKKAWEELQHHVCPAFVTTIFLESTLTESFPLAMDINWRS
jgi:hypothetical protein